MFSSLSTRLIAWTLVLAGGVYLVTIVLSNRAARTIAIASAEREANNDTDAAVIAVQDVLDSVEESTAALARTVSELAPDSEELDKLVRRFSTDEGGTVARYAVILAGTASEETAPEWYHEARQKGTPLWTEPFRDPGLQNATVIARVVPLKGSSGSFGGAVAASLRLDFLSAVVREVHLGTSGFALVVSRNGLLVAHSRRDLSEGLHDPLSNLSPALQAVFEPVLRRALSGESGFAAVPVNDRVFRLTFRPIPGTEWFLATGYAEDELLAGVVSLQRRQIAVALSGLVLLTVAIVVLSRRITKPLIALSASAGRVATGDLDGPLPDVASHDEVGALSAAFRHMQASLKTYIRNLEETTAAKERLEGEVLAARRIQTDMLPRPTAGGGAAGYELAAALEPARSVGGDLFDHFEADGRVFFLVGDVSGKGVAAALFMARTKTLFDVVARAGGDPGTVFASINRGLCLQNEAGMYVTAVCGVLDVRAGVVTFATAGHEPPILVPAGGEPAPLVTEGGTVLGLMDLGGYPTTTVKLAKGDALVMYTDGVSEARDPNDDFFGTDRLLAGIGRIGSAAAGALTRGLLQDVKAFAATAPQSDDITILTLKRT